MPWTLLTALAASGSDTCQEFVVKLGAPHRHAGYIMYVNYR